MDHLFAEYAHEWLRTKITFILKACAQTTEGHNHIHLLSMNVDRPVAFSRFFFALKKKRSTLQGRRNRNETDILLGISSAASQIEIYETDILLGICSAASQIEICVLPRSAGWK
jgi:hypothetical protein